LGENYFRSFFIRNWFWGKDSIIIPIKFHNSMSAGSSESEIDSDIEYYWSEADESANAENENSDSDGLGGSGDTNSDPTSRDIERFENKC
jgi:hypothetical protein